MNTKLLAGFQTTIGSGVKRRSAVELVEFKDEALRDEFNGYPKDGVTLNPVLRAVILGIGYYLAQKGQKPLLATCFSRTKDENDALSGSNPVGAHLRGDAGDFRVKDPLTGLERYSQGDIDALIKHVKATWGNMVHILLHSPQGGAPHIHININYPFSRGAKVWGNQ